MQNRQNPQKTTSFIKSAPALSAVVPASRKNRLGTIVKLCSTVDSKEKNLAAEKAREYRKRNIKLKDRAGQILYIPNQRKQAPVCSCGKCRIDGSAPVGVDYNQKTGMASYTNLQYCGSVWVCPDCSYKISQERKKELAEAMKGCR
ncbi:replication protein, partial [Acinetobacter baumannii]|nr:replication protein [Acinetobacter baumannii]